MDPLVSIVIPVYNGGQFIEECLESIKKQTYKNFECVITNNCSTDETKDIVLKYVASDKRFKLVDNTEFVGLVANWNNAFSNSDKTAKYFQLVQADDWIYPACIESKVALMEANDDVGVCSSYRLVESEVTLDSLNVNDGSVFNGKDILNKQLNKQVDISGSITNMFFRMDVLKKLDYYPNIFNGIYHIDTELFYDVLHISDVGFIYQVLNFSRRHENAETLTKVFKLNTLINFREDILFRYKDDNKEYLKLYNDTRTEYAYFYFINKLFGNNSVIEWHKPKLKRPFKSGEYFKAVLYHNIFITKFRNLMKRFI